MNSSVIVQKLQVVSLREIDYLLTSRGNDFIIPLLDVSQILWHYGFHSVLIGRATAREGRHMKGAFSTH